MFGSAFLSEILHILLSHHSHFTVGPTSHFVFKVFVQCTSSEKLSYFSNCCSTGFVAGAYYFRGVIVVELLNHSKGQCFDSFEFTIVDTYHL